MINLPMVNFINILHEYFLYESAFFNLHVTREELPKRLSYKKGVLKMLMKNLHVVNFINILCANFLYEYFTQLFSSYILSL